MPPLPRLARYACDPAASRGRRFAEPPAPTRSAFQRDRDRIVHSTAFRRLVYKTQVFLNHEGDLFRTRLTHSLEVAQLARSIARTLALEEDLVEAIALAHDLGHTPFGHAGQDVLNECMAAHGGFEHNLQSLRVVDELEERYASFDGLNLSFETREGILKHCSPANARALEQAEPGGVGRRFLERTQPSLEAQLCNIADEIAYNAHDIDDGVRSGLIEMEQLASVDLFERHRRQALAEHPELQGRRVLYETIRRMLSAQVYDVIAATRESLARLDPRSPDDVRRAPGLVCFSEPMRAESSQLKRFLLQNLYRHPQVTQTTQRAKQIVRELFQAYEADISQVGGGFDARADRHRAISDYIAGMTDRFAAREHGCHAGCVPRHAMNFSQPSAAHHRIFADTRRWLDRAVIGLNLCPFAKAVHVKGQVHLAVSEGITEAEIIADLDRELADLMATPSQVRDTTLLILPYLFGEFLAFHAFVLRCEKRLRRQGFEGDIQLASFHPDFCFADAEPDDVANFSNRSPYPMLHLLREASITRAVDAHPAPESIYESNIRRLQQLGADGWRALDVGRSR
jgi:dGTPase